MNEPSNGDNEVLIESELREFVYLDQVALASLWASRYGEVIEQVTDTRESALEAELAAGVEGLSPFMRARLQSTLRSREVGTAQVQRKASAQATFKRFYERERERFKLSTGALASSSRHLIADGPPSTGAPIGQTIGRGDLIELEGSLIADKIFRASSMVSVMAEMASAHPTLFGASLGVIDSVAPVNELVTTLLAGLIPLRCSETSIVAVKSGDRHVIADASIREDDRYRDAKPVELVGVTVENLYWKDIRRVLFEGARYKLLCRLTDGRLSDTWAPVVLSNVLRELAPELADMMNRFGDDALDAMKAKKLKADDDNAIEVSTALTAYEELVRRELEVERSTDISDIIGALSGHTGIEAQNQLFHEVQRRVEAEAVSRVLTSTKGLALRSSARASAGMSPLERLTSSDGKVQPLLLRAEIVAIYW